MSWYPPYAPASTAPSRSPGARPATAQNDGSRVLELRKPAGFCACPAHDIAYAAWFAGDVGYRIGGIRAPYVEALALRT